MCQDMPGLTSWVPTLWGTEVKFISVFINPTYSLSVSDACEFPRDTVRIHPEIKIVHK